MFNGDKGNHNHCCLYVSSRWISLRKLDSVRVPEKKLNTKVQPVPSSDVPMHTQVTLKLMYAQMALRGAVCFAAYDERVPGAPHTPGSNVIVFKMFMRFLQALEAIGDENFFRAVCHELEVFLVVYRCTRAVFLRFLLYCQRAPAYFNWRNYEASLSALDMVDQFQKLADIGDSPVSYWPLGHLNVKLFVCLLRTKISFARRDYAHAKSAADECAALLASIDTETQAVKAEVAMLQQMAATFYIEEQRLFIATLVARCLVPVVQGEYVHDFRFFACRVIAEMAAQRDEISLALGVANYSWPQAKNEQLRRSWPADLSAFFAWCSYWSSGYSRRALLEVDDLRQSLKDYTRGEDVFDGHLSDYARSEIYTKCISGLCLTEELFTDAGKHYMKLFGAEDERSKQCMHAAGVCLAIGNSLPKSVILESEHACHKAPLIDQID